MTDRIRKALGELKVRQSAGEPMPCPRCGRNTMKENIHTNALSRHTDVYICDACGTEEALLKFMSNPLLLREWACFRPTPLPSDFKTLPVEQIWERVRDTQLPFLMNLYERWQDEHEYEDFNDYRAAAFENCPGLTALWAQPFRAEYAAADGSWCCASDLPMRVLRLLPTLRNSQFDLIASFGVLFLCPYALRVASVSGAERPLLSLFQRIRKPDTRADRQRKSRLRIWKRQ